MFYLSAEHFLINVIITVYRVRQDQGDITES